MLALNGMHIPREDFVDQEMKWAFFADLMRQTHEDEVAARAVAGDDTALLCRLVELRFQYRLESDTDLAHLVDALLSE
jgi:hypothetical protein